MSIVDPIADHFYAPALRHDSAPQPQAWVALQRRQRTPLPSIDLPAVRRALCALGRVDDLRHLGHRGPLRPYVGPESDADAIVGRDAIWMAFDLLDQFPCVADTTLLALATLQGVEYDPQTTEEPGRILHERRQPADADTLRLGSREPLLTYDAVDTTPQWIRLLAAYTDRAGDSVLSAPIVDRRGRQIILFDCLLAATEWLLARLRDPVGGGYLCVRRSSPPGAAGRVWDDTPDAYGDADSSSFADDELYAPIALQGYAYDALLDAAEIVARHPTPLAGRLPERLTPHLLQSWAAGLRARILRDFWQPDLGTFALAATFDGPGKASAAARGRIRPVRVVASNPGHLLASRLLDGTDVARLRERLVRRLFEPDLLAGAGLRTRSTGAACFRPGGAHTGAVWPLDTGIVADGLRRHGYDACADELDARLLAACAAVGGFPEYFRGDEDGRIAVNVATIDELVDGALHRLEGPPRSIGGCTVTRVWRIASRRRD